MLLLERNRNNSNSQIPLKAGSFFCLSILVVIAFMPLNVQSGPCCSKSSAAVVYNDFDDQKPFTPDVSVVVPSDKRCTNESPTTKSFESIDLNKNSNSSLNNFLPNCIQPNSRMQRRLRAILAANSTPVDPHEAPF